MMLDPIPGFDEPVTTVMACGCSIRMSWGRISIFNLCNDCKPLHDSNKLQQQRERYC